MVIYQVIAFDTNTDDIRTFQGEDLNEVVHNAYKDYLNVFSFYDDWGEIDFSMTVGKLAYYAFEREVEKEVCVQCQHSHAIWRLKSFEI